MHWQAVHIAGPLRALKDREEAPLGQALAAVSWALVLILQAMCLAEPAGSRAGEVTVTLADAHEELTAAQRHLHRLDEQTANLAADLEGLVVAVEDAMRAQRIRRLTEQRLNGWRCRWPHRGPHLQSRKSPANSHLSQTGTRKPDGDEQPVGNGPMPTATNAYRWISQTCGRNPGLT